MTKFKFKTNNSVAIKNSFYAYVLIDLPSASEVPVAVKPSFIPNFKISNWITELCSVFFLGQFSKNDSKIDRFIVVAVSKIQIIYKKEVEPR